MNRKSHIVLLDPGLKDNQGHPSGNLGDLIISESCQEYLQAMFPAKEITRISTHSFFAKKEIDLINQAAFCFVGGTNLLHSNMLGPRIFMMRKGKLLWLFPGVRDLVLMGVGWGHGYQDKVTFRTRVLYKKILHPAFVHSLRDSFSSRKLKDCSGKDTVNTTCPSMWKLDGKETNLDKSYTTCLFTLTDYKQDSVADERLIAQLLEHFNRLVFFPQGSRDIEYINSLDIYARNKGRIELLPHSYDQFRSFLRTEEFLYIGTRLHAGIKCLDEGRKALIIGIDNRARDIAIDSFLPVVDRHDNIAIDDWLSRKQVFNKKISIPLEAISNWKNQFK